MCFLSETWELYSSNILSSASRRSIVCETGRWNNYIIPFFGEKEVSNLTSLDVAKFRAFLSLKKLSPQTIYHCLSLLRRVLNRSKEWELYSGQMPAFKMPKFDNKRLRFLSPQEAERLLHFLKYSHLDWYDIAIVALNTGLRAGEIFKLTSMDVQLEKNLLVVLDTKIENNRVVPLNIHSRAALERNLNPWSPSSRIFSHNSCKTFSRAVEACGFNIGVADRRHRVVFHTLRHTFASWLVQARVPLAVVSQLMGHKNLKMTMRYAHLEPQQTQEAIQYLATIDVGLSQ
jgi:integrase